MSTQRTITNKRERKVNLQWKGLADHQFSQLAKVNITSSRTKIQPVLKEGFCSSFDRTCLTNKGTSKTLILAFFCVFYFLKRFYLFILERGAGGRKRGREASI